MKFDESHTHGGHRARMRSKLAMHGERIFDTYELLEMLLYYAVPYKDTNPIAKRLLAELGSLDAVLSAPVERLAEVDGIGPRCAELIHEAGRAMQLAELSAGINPPTVFDERDKAGRFIVDYFNLVDDCNIIAVLLDNSMRLIGVAKIAGERFGSGVVQPHAFIDAALGSGATVVIVGYTHRNGMPYPMSGDIPTGKMLYSELGEVGVTMIEQYVVGKDSFTALGVPVRLRASMTPQMRSFFASSSGGGRV